jgi:UDP-3-O-[3-hydroxymyristoyl] glucosamine N-acyltransferase
MEVVRDGEFQSLGLLTGRHPATLACLYDPARAGAWHSNSAVSCVITSPALAPSVPETFALGVTPSPRETFVDAQRYLGSSTEFYGSDCDTEISKAAHIHPDARIAPRNVRIASDCFVEAGAVVLEHVELGQGCVIRAGAIVGAEGFHPVAYGDGIVNMPHHGRVRIGQGVEVGAGSVVCRSVFSSPTSIGNGTIIGPMTYVAHGTTIGTHCRIAAAVRICGSSIIGDRVFVGPNAVIANLIEIGDDARVSLGSVVVRNVEPGQAVSGNFAIDHQKFIQLWARSAR